MDVIENFPPGPLDKYRNIASFNWKKMKIILETEEVVIFKKNLIKTLESLEILKPPLQPKTFSEMRQISIQRMFSLMNIQETNVQGIDRRIVFAIYEYLTMIDASTSMRLTLQFGLFLNVIQAQGTERHWDIYDKCYNERILGCFCLTEVGHGSNTRGIRTRATYDVQRKQFILHTPDFQAAKCWPGQLGKVTRYAIVYAQLYTPDGICHGIHAFLIKIRDDCLNNMPGVIAGDLGEKIGLNSVDNGFMIFNNYGVPRESLLNKIADVTEDGKYVTPIKDPTKRFGASLGALSAARLSIISLCEFYLNKSVTIALRYAAVRKQFGPENSNEEIPILEYQTHQYRLLPYLATVYVFKILAEYIYNEQHNFTIDLVSGSNADRTAEFGLEIHLLSCAAKSVSSWLSRDGIQECREACGGHGYLKAAEIGDLRNDNDANMTYEGENHVLIQQTTNLILKKWPLVMSSTRISTPMKTLDFLSDANEILGYKFDANTIEEISDPEYIIKMYKWLTCYLTKITYIKYGQIIKEGKGTFWAKNETQIFYAKNLGIAYMQQVSMTVVLNFINTVEDQACKSVLTKLLSLYGLFTIEKLATHLYQGNFFSGEKPAVLLQDAILKLCLDIKDDAVALIDVIAPPDFIMKSVLGKSDGKIYEHLEKELLKPGSTDRPSWWEDVVNWKSYAPAKL